MLMRARLSDPSARGPLGCRYLGMLAPREAVNEAWAILAENEPRQEQGMSGHWPCGRYLSGTAWAAHGAITYSLAALCDALDTAAYLADLQPR